MRRHIAILLFILCVNWFASETAHSYRILAVIGTPSYSHQIPYQPLWMELNKRGHEVVLVTTDPIPNYNATNFTQIDISIGYTKIREIDFVKLRVQGSSWFELMKFGVWPTYEEIAEEIFKNEQVKELYAPDSNATFDVFLTELLLFPAVKALAHRFNAPMIGLSSLGLLSVYEHVLGGIPLPSHEYTWEMESHTGSNLPFLKRLRNFFVLWKHLYDWYHHFFPRHQVLAEKYLGKLPPLEDIVRNTSLIFVQQSEVLTPARPKLANMITFTASHVNQKPAPLTQGKLKQFLDDAKEGVIYFSLGTNAMSSNLPIELQRMFCDVFAKLPYRVVWKYEKELPGKPDNVYIGRWLPQQSILAHPKVKLFIYQGGLQSSEEAIHNEVPVIGFPVLADQDYQVGRMEALGIGKRFELTTVTKEEFENAIREIITDPQYKERMKNIKKVAKDIRDDPVENLVWWTEYVMRTKGATHLRSNLAWQPWYQRYDTDIIVFLTIVTMIISIISVNLTANLFVFIRRRLQSSCQSNTSKQKLS